LLSSKVALAARIDVSPYDHRPVASLRHNLKLLHIVDEFTREALAIECHRRIDADHTVKVLDRLVARRGTAPGFIRCDNGPEMTANALRDWCRFSRAGSAYIEPGSPWQNP
jgi:putative transposase